MPLVRVLICVFALLFGAGSTWAATAIDTTSSWNGGQSVGTFGFPNTATYGQVITVPSSDTRLTDFSFFVALPATSIFRAAVYTWDSAQKRATGASVYESPPRFPAGAGMQKETFTPLTPLALVAGQQYVLLLSVSKDQGSGTGSVGYTGADVYAGGAFYSQNNGSDASQWTSTAWLEYGFPAGGDLALVANFDGGGPATAPAPDPGLAAIPALDRSGLFLLATLAALLGLGFLRKRR